MSSMQSLRLQIVIIMACSEIKTHLLPSILSLMDVGVKLASSSAVMKFEPPLAIILLIETARSVYQNRALAIR
jgi:hypothetical protein